MALSTYYLWWYNRPPTAAWSSSSSSRPAAFHSPRRPLLQCCPFWRCRNEGKGCWGDGHWGSGHSGLGHDRTSGHTHNRSKSTLHHSVPLPSANTTPTPIPLHALLWKPLLHCAHSLPDLRHWLLFSPLQTQMHSHFQCSLNSFAYSILAFSWALASPEVL